MCICHVLLLTYISCDCVPCLLAKCFSGEFCHVWLESGQPKHLSLWVGTSSGHVFIYQLTVPDGEKRREEDVTCYLGKYHTTARSAVSNKQILVVNIPLTVSALQGKGCSLNIEPLTILDSGALQPRKWQLTGIDCSTAVQASGCP